ncbi:phosphodiester glycosidase family protein [Daejeonella oryzae]|uniref:phosphodiester glycosidase family protein n=1 Tax=Daejeonella oryzae TaxID=1122943 RepID=UPI0003F81833|nr:phosphodiester glycosidase family protein [Daejeonella oryzae]
MKRFLLSVLFLLSATLITLAQSDSINVVKAKWEVSKVSRGVKLKQYWFNNSLFNSSQHVSIVEIKRRARHAFDLAYEEKSLKSVTEFAASDDVIAVINGTFFDIKNGGSVDFIKSDGKVINENRLSETKKRTFHQKSAVAFNEGKISIEKWNGQDGWEQKVKAEDLMVTGPLLIVDSKPEKLDSISFNTSRHPRSAVAVLKNKRVLLLTVDGRNEKSAGMNLIELSKLLTWLKASDGINLDGGGSTTLLIKDKAKTEVVNYPSDNKKWDHQGERKVANVILLRKK